MGIVDEVKASFGEDFFDRKPVIETRHNWGELCVCGHLGRYHSPSIGGTYVLKEPFTQAGSSVTWAFFGCAGAMPGRGFEPYAAMYDQDTNTGVYRVNPTCPCTEFRPVATVDRPNRFFNQRMPTDRKDPAKHPFMVGIRAFMTHLSRRKQAIANPDWYAEEFDRRFTWLDDKRRCGISKCKETDDVWPVFVNTGDGQPGDRSELRCAKHR